MPLNNDQPKIAYFSLSYADLAALIKTLPYAQDFGRILAVESQPSDIGKQKVKIWVEMLKEERDAAD